MRRAAFQQCRHYILLAAQNMFVGELIFENFEKKPMAMKRPNVCHKQRFKHSSNSKMFSQSLWLQISGSLKTGCRKRGSNFLFHWMFVAVKEAATDVLQMYWMGLFFSAHSSSARQTSPHCKDAAHKMTMLIKEVFLVSIDSQFRPTAQSYKGRSRTAIY